MMKQGQYNEPITHDNVLATIQAIYGLTPLGNAAGVKPIKMRGSRRHEIQTESVAVPHESPYQ